jgi:hypothetical protein
MPYYFHGTSYAPKLAIQFDYFDIKPGQKKCHFYERPNPTDNTKPDFDKSPDFAKVDSGHKSVPDLFMVESSLAVSEALKNLIETYEPGVHQFHKIILLKKNKTPFDGNFYLFNITTLVDAIIYEKSSIKREKNPYNTPGREYRYDYARVNEVRVLNKKLIEGKHVWGDLSVSLDIYFSDEFAQEYIKNKFKGADDIIFASAE